MNIFFPLENAGVYPGRSQAFMMELYVKVSFIIDVGKGSRYTYEMIFRVWIQFWKIIREKNRKICTFGSQKKKEELKKLESLPSLSLKIYSSVAIMARNQKMELNEGCSWSILITIFKVCVDGICEHFKLRFVLNDTAQLVDQFGTMPLWP